MRKWFLDLPLRYKLSLVALAIEALMLALLVGNSVRLNNAELQEQGQLRAQQVAETLAAALGPPLAQRDNAGVHDIIATLYGHGQIAHLTVRDRSNRLVDEVGVPRRGEDFVQQASIVLGGQRYGELDLALSAAFVRHARAAHLSQSVLIALVALLLTGMLLHAAVGWLVRRFEALSRATRSMAQGDLYVTLPEEGDDEVGQLVQTFNQMVQSVRASIGRARDNEARFHAIADYTYDVELWLSPSGKLLWVNPSVERVLGYTVNECMASMDFPLDAVYRADHQAVEFQLRHALRGTSGQGYSLRMQRRDGSHFWAVMNWQPIHDVGGAYQGIRASIHDVDDQKAVEGNMRQALVDLRIAQNLQAQYLKDSEQERARLVSLLAAMNLGILFVAADGRVIYHNATFSRMWLIDEAVQLIGLPVQEALSRSVAALARPDHFSRHLLSVLEAREVSDSFEIQMTDGRVVTELDYPVRDPEGGFIGHLWIYEDITRERQTAEQLVYLAERDALSGLYNRHRFQTELTRALLECDRQKTRCAVMFFDLDDFKSVNDTWGHRAGDALLIRVAGEISALVRKNEVLARLGGDEFAILLPAVRDDEADRLAERVVRAVAQIPFRFEGQNLRLTTSLGIAYYPDQAADSDELVARADIAMYQAKQAGKNAWRVYRADLDTQDEMRTRLSWAERISNAFARGLFELHFQGIYRADGLKLSHLEALIRLNDETAEGQLIMPDHFIPVAEKNGMIVDIDRWVIRDVLQILALDANVPPIAVNLSGRSVSESTLPHYIAEELRISGVDPRRLIVEITETAAVTDLHDAQRLIEALRQQGVGVCLDDFGVGFASFAYLKHLKVDTINIDGLFIHNLYNDTDNQVFVRAMVDVARGLGKAVVAEYVEDARALALLQTFGVDMVQGYHLDRPRPDHPALAA